MVEGDRKMLTIHENLAILQGQINQLKILIGDSGGDVPDDILQRLEVLETSVDDITLELRTITDNVSKNTSDISTNKTAIDRINNVTVPVIQDDISSIYDLITSVQDDVNIKSDKLYNHRITFAPLNEDLNPLGLPVFGNIIMQHNTPITDLLPVYNYRTKFTWESNGILIGTSPAFLIPVGEPLFVDGDFRCSGIFILNKAIELVFETNSNPLILRLYEDDITEV